MQTMWQGFNVAAWGWLACFYMGENGHTEYAAFTYRSVLNQAAIPDSTLSRKKQTAEVREWLYFSIVHSPTWKIDQWGISRESTCHEEKSL